MRRAPALPPTLGPRIRALRKAKGFGDVRALAKASGISKSTLARLEAGQAGGTFNTHQRIAEALGVPLPELYEGLATPTPDAVVIGPTAEEAETFTYDEKAQAVLLARQVTGKQMLPQLVVLQPGGRTAVEQYRPGTERWGFGLAGTVEVVVGAQRYHLAPGSAVYFKASLPHQFVNVQSSVAKVISVTSPAAV